ncbi:MULTISPECIES: DUF4198 domain-containing protein [unclassified Acinetobacter]|uniref:DUF4198 domain-containing protein n=1 Tax=unclassified Acinetobacter TaxID=196816 RepID=UPI0035B908E6
MQKKLAINILALSLLSQAPFAVAHEVWVEPEHTHGGEILKANLGYGDFPELKPIAADRQHIFKKPLQLVTAQGTEDLIAVKGGQNYQFQTQKAVENGSYLLLAEYSPTFWSENKDGWKQVDMTAMPDAKYCEQTQMYGKNVVNVGHHANSKDIVTKPVGQGLEIVPMDNPANARVGEPFGLKVLFNGEPLANEIVVATFEGFVKKDPNDKVHKLEPQAFSDTTRSDGTVKLYPLRQGFWKVRVVHKSDFPNPQQCQKLASYATLSFVIGKAAH